MYLVMDIGNTRTKWAQVDAEGKLYDIQACANHDFSNQILDIPFEAIQKVIISNVAGPAMAERVAGCIPPQVAICFARVSSEAGGVINRYQQTQLLGVDRWAALVAAWQKNKQPSIVVNVGTAVTIDALAKEAKLKKGIFIGGMILPGLRLMRESLQINTAQLAGHASGQLVAFPTNTADAIESGCINAVVGAIVLMVKQLEKYNAFLPKLIISGGDAGMIASALKPHFNQVTVVEQLVLQGLVFLEKAQQ